MLNEEVCRQCSKSEFHGLKGPAWWSCSNKVPQGISGCQGLNRKASPPGWCEYKLEHLISVNIRIRADICLRCCKFLRVGLRNKDHRFIVCGVKDRHGMALEAYPGKEDFVPDECVCRLEYMMLNEKHIDLKNPA